MAEMEMEMEDEYDEEYYDEEMDLEEMDPNQPIYTADVGGQQIMVNAQGVPIQVVGGGIDSSSGDALMADGFEFLEEELDENYEPTAEEIEEYAKYLGMDLQADRNLFYIAKEGLKAPLPGPWKPCKSPDGAIYYYNFDTKEIQKDHPCDDYYRKYYLNEKQLQTKKREEKVIKKQIKKKKQEEELQLQIQAQQVLEQQQQAIELGASAGSS